MIEWTPASKAKDLAGLRVVLAKGVWAVWSECTKNILAYKKLPYAAVPQRPFETNEDIVAWTGVRNQPQVIFESDPVRTGWLEILNLTERLAPERALLPKDSSDRATVVGLSNELCGEWGLGWCKRLQWVDPNTASGLVAEVMRAEYGMKDLALREAATLRMADIVATLAARLKDQHARGSRYFVGDRLTAIDIYWSCFSNLVRPLPHELCPMSPEIRASFSQPGEPVEKALDPILIDHRNFVYRTYLPLPIDFG